MGGVEREGTDVVISHGMNDWELTFRYQPYRIPKLQLHWWVDEQSWRSLVVCFDVMLSNVDPA